MEILHAGKWEMFMKDMWDVKQMFACIVYPQNVDTFLKM